MLCAMKLNLNGSWTPRKGIDMKSELTAIPGVGENMAAHLNALGIWLVDELKGKDPEALYAQECAQQGCTVDRCVLYVYRLAVAWAEGRIESPEQLKWWNWKD